MSATYTNFYIRPAGSTRQKDLMYAIRNEKELQDPLPEELGEYFQKEMKVEMDHEVCVRNFPGRECRNIEMQIGRKES